MSTNHASDDTITAGGTACHVTCCDNAKPPRESWGGDNLDDWLHPAAFLLACTSDKDITWAKKVETSLDSVQAALAIGAARFEEDPLDPGFACAVLTLNGFDPLHVSSLATITRDPAYGYDICRAIAWARLGVKADTITSAGWFHLDLGFIEQWLTTFGSTDDLDLLLAAIPWDRPVDRKAYGDDIARYLESGQVPDRLALRTIAALVPQRP